MSQEGEVMHRKKDCEGGVKVPLVGDSATGGNIRWEVAEPCHCSIASPGDDICKRTLAEEESMAPVHGIQGQGTCETPSFRVDSSWLVRLWQLEEPDICRLKE